MPEGPSIVILKEELAPFKRKKITGVKGNTRIDLSRLMNLRVKDFKSWGKHLLICFKDFFLRIHLLMWGSYRINEKKGTPERLSLEFQDGEINFYNCSIKLVEDDIENIYNWKVDVMSDEWSPAYAERALKRLENVKACDALLDQEIFAGVGNIIKNEVLFRIKVHPDSIIGALPPKKLKELVKEARNYSMDFYRWKKVFELKKHYLVYKKKMCPRCDLPLVRTYMGKNERLTCFCPNCQELYAKAPMTSNLKGLDKYIF